MKYGFEITEDLPSVDCIVMGNDTELTFKKLEDISKMLCTRDNPFEHWDYPEEKEPLNEDELKQLTEELEKYNKKNPVKIVFK